MIAPPAERLDAIVARRDIITAMLASGPDVEAYVALSRELSDLDPVVEAIRAYRAAADNLAGLYAMVEDSATDAEMRALRIEAMQRRGFRAEGQCLHVSRERRRAGDPAGEPRRRSHRPARSTQRRPVRDARVHLDEQRIAHHAAGNQIGSR